MNLSFLCAMKSLTFLFDFSPCICIQVIILLHFNIVQQYSSAHHILVSADILADDNNNNSYFLRILNFLNEKF